MDEFTLDTFDEVFYDFEDNSDIQTIDFKNSLNEQQYQVVTEADGPSLVLAGAGSGKTRVLIYRLAYLIEQGISPENILLVTFTNKAAKEMKDRAEGLLKTDLYNLWMGTFHSIGARILRREAEHIGYSPDFTILDQEDAIELIDEAMDELGLKKQAKFLPKKNLILSIHSHAVNSQKSIDDTIFDQYPQLEEFLVHIRRISQLYKKKKKENNVMDFDDLLLNWLKILEDEAILQNYGNQFKYILVDEYQDTNKVQFGIIKKLAKLHNNILAVGDDAQSIYSFRAAEIKNILEFPEQFEDSKIFKLETNYRSSPQIVNLANHSIINNKDQFNKELQAIQDSHIKPILVKASDTYKQARFVTKKIRDYQSLGIPINDIAVLVRSRFQAMELEMEMLKHKIPYVIRGGKRFFEQAHIKDALSYMKIIQNPLDELAFKRALCLKPGIGKKGAQKLWTQLIKERKSFDDVYKKATKKQKEGFKEFYNTIVRIKEKTAPADMLRAIIEDYNDYCYTSFDNYNDRMMDLDELIKMADKYDSITAFTEALGLYEGFDSGNKDNNQDALVISTIHQAKGLEWDVVFVLGLNEMEFPHPRCLESRSKLEEERRLFYVAITRTRKDLYMIYPELKYTRYQGPMFAQPSMFLIELPSGLYEKLKVV